MAKYVCDFEVLTEVGQQLQQSSSDLTGASSDYAGKFESSLNSWQGSSKQMLTTQHKGQIDVANQKAQYISEFGQFIQQTSQSMQELESQLAGLNI